MQFLKCGGFCFGFGPLLTGKFIAKITAKVPGKIKQGAALFLALIFCSFGKISLAPAESGMGGIKNPALRSENAISEDYYQAHVQKIFDQRCVACHSCFNAPCQLNLQNFNGFARGANADNVYNGTRTKSVLPTRLDIDATTVADWHTKGFFTVNNSKDLNQNLFWKSVQLRNLKPTAAPTQQVAYAAQCAQNPSSFETLAPENPSLGMPYGFPPLTSQELKKLQIWLAAGAPGKNISFKSPKAVKNQITQWENYLNQKDLRQRLISRYVFEHLFLAHLYFPERPQEFYRLVRSQTECSKGLSEIATRRPNDSPGVENFYYCLKPFTATVVKKTHLPYEFSAKKLSRLKQIFNAEPWKVSALPSYDPGVAENPFIAFADIPVKARYQFLLEDSRYHVASFIKGPVCNGSMAVNSIQEQFFVFFLNPESENMQLSAEYAKKVAPLLTLPGVWGSDIEVLETPVLAKKMTDHRESYRQARLDMFKKTKPQGYSLQDIWDGDKSNPNAVLTVFRHDDNAVVQTGAAGDLPKTVFVLDYPLFERLVYNLVVNFDVFGNVSHQLLTRVYMDMIRMEAEELFLMFLPPEQRLRYRQNWYRGLLAKAKMTYIFPTVGAGQPTSVRFTEETETKRQMVEKILFYRLDDSARGQLDFLNWRHIQIPDALAVKSSATGLDNQLSPLASVVAVDERPFARFFPEFSVLKIKLKNGDLRVYSLIHNREHENISWITGESLRYAPQEDTLTIREGYWGSYPNMIFATDEKDLSNFVKLASLLRSPEDYQALVQAFGLRRSRPDFWAHFDEIQSHQRKLDPTEAGILDLTRYELQ